MGRQGKRKWNGEGMEYCQPAVRQGVMECWIID